MLSCLILDTEMQCALPVLESLRERGLRVTAGSHKYINMGFFSRYPHRRIIYPSPKHFPAAFVERILALAKNEHYDFVLPTDDVSSELLSPHKKEFEKYTQLPIAPYDTFMKARDKSQTLKIALQNHLPCPKTFFPDEHPIEQIAQQVSYPVLVKPNISSGSRGIAFVSDSSKLAEIYQTVKAEWGECHIQEFIPTGGTQYKADLFLDKNQELRAGIVYSKLRYFPINGGSSIVNCTVLQPQILHNAYTLLLAMGWTGFADFDFVTDPRDDTPKIVEINPRLPACFRITLAAGIDFPYLIAKFATGDVVPQFQEYKLNVYLRYFPLDLLWFFKSSERFTAKPSFFNFFGKNLYDQIISLKDPGPTIGFCLENFLALFDWRSRKSRYSRGW
jgi:D-aspartate ligase